MTQSPNDIAAELERLAEIATPGPWKAGRPDMLSSAVYAGGEVGEMGKYVYREPDVHLAEVAFPAFHIPEPNSIADAQLIVFLRNHHAEIIAALRAAGEVERMREALEAIARNADDATDLTLFRVQCRDFARRALGSAKE